MEWAKNRRVAAGIILGLALFLFFFRLGSRPLRNPDEGRYAQIAGQMAQSGNWLEPKLFGIDYLRKPPLFYWLVAGSFKIFGQNEWAARAVPALFGVLGVLATYFFSRRFFGDRAAAFSALLLIANPWYLHVSRYLVIDSVFSFFVVSSLYLYYLAAASSEGRVARFVLFYLFVALAFLTKGILALVFPALAVFFYALFTRQFLRVLKESHLFLGIGVFLLVVAPWFWWISVHKPAFWEVFFIREHLARFASQNFEHQAGWYFYPALFLGFLSPWILFPGPLRFAAANAQKDFFKNPSFFLLIAGLAGIFFLSLSKSKLATYLLPAMAPFCVVLGAGWDEWTQKKSVRIKIFYGLLGVMALSAFGVIFAMEIVNFDYSTKSFAQFAKTQIKEGAAVYVYDHPGPFYDFGFYFGGPVRPVGLEGEFEISRDDQEALKISITKEEFLKSLERHDHFYCILRKSDWKNIPEGLRPRLKVLIEDGRKLLFESNPMADLSLKDVKAGVNP